mmetsp:Transcript_41031/g.80482  ORF Transcript_41031/g.80482 Transcript_41031/m.80482 type:complete len:449 (-) Transcript_41031:42-1388(-)
MGDEGENNVLPPATADDDNEPPAGTELNISRQPSMEEEAEQERLKQKKIDDAKRARALARKKAEKQQAAAAAAAAAAEEPKPRSKEEEGESSGVPTQDEEVKDIWTQLLEMKSKEEKENPSSAMREANIVFLGPRHSGKSTLIHAYMHKDKEDVVKPTTSLDYKYTRSSVGMSMEKDLSHFWELGGGRALVNLLDIALTADTIAHTFALIVVDLSRPSAVVDDVQYWLGVLKNRVKAVVSQLSQSSSPLPKALLAEAKAQYGADHSELGQIDWLEVPVMIVAHKYDTFKDQEPELLKTMSKALRSIAHANGASLLYTSKMDKQLIHSFRSRISRHVLGRAPSKVLQGDYTKAISVPAGSDTFSNIGAAPDGRGGQVQAWIETHRKYFPPNDQDKEATLAVKDVVLNAEPLVDQMLAQKDEDLKQVRRKLQLKRRMKQADNAAEVKSKG